MGSYICKCNSIKESEIVRIIKEQNVRSYDELRQHTKAGSKECCKKDLKKLIKK